MLTNKEKVKMYKNQKNKTMKQYIAILVVLLITSVEVVSAQQDAQYTQYMYNTIVVNPAYAGSRGVFSAAALHRSQWVGLDGAPTTQTLNVNSPVSKNLGLGLSVVRDEIGNGTLAETSFDASASYTIRTSRTAKLSFGLKAGGHLLNVNYAQLSGYGIDKMASDLPQADKKFSPNIGVGVYYHTDKFYLGLSAPNLLETEHFDTSKSSGSHLATERINYYAIAGYVFDLSYNLKFKPAVLFKAVSGAPLQADVSANFMYNEKFTFGAAYRWDAAVSALVGFQISDSFMIGVGYDKETTALGNSSFNSGSFEIMLRYELYSKVKRLITPRFF